ncbi:MAG: EAL domain-containing protein [Giesbergeria sp.]|nr:EAL domain-containing protein [Giesbergeria sp.]
MQVRLQNTPIGQRIALALALPIAGFLFFALWVLEGQHRIANEMRNLRELTELATTVGGLVHEVQRERGMTAAFLGSGGKDFAEMQTARHAYTDTQLEGFHQALERLVTERFAQRLHWRIAEARTQLGQLNAWRREAAQLQVTPEVQTARYSAAIYTLIGIVQEMHLLGIGSEMSRSLYAYVNLMQAKELAGMERALGATYFSSPRVDTLSRQVFVGLTERQAHFMEQFRFFATRAQVDFLVQVLSDIKAAEIERLRGIVFQRSPDRGASPAKDTAHWFDVVSWKIDQIKRAEDRMSQDLIEAARRAEMAASQTVLWSGGAALVALALTLLFAGALARGIIYPIQRITNAMNRLAAPDAPGGGVEIEDHGRGDEIGEMARATLVFRDNLIRIAQAEERLKNAVILRLHHKALGSISQGVLIVDAQGNATFANAALCAITGYPEDEILGRPPEFLWTDADSRAALWDSAGVPCTLPGKRRDGTPFWFEATVSLVQDNQGEATHRVVVLRDITENRRIEQEMRIAATAFESLHGMIVTDANGIILRVNRAFTRMTGYAPEEVIGHTPAMFKSGRHDADFYIGMWQSLADRGAWFGEIWDRRKNGEVYPLLQSISAVRGDDGQVTHYVAAFSDISERKEAEEKIRHLAFYDPLTRLPNRRLLLDRLQQAMVLGGRTGHHGALLFIDLDQFKSLNDTLGHDVGDLLLMEVARRLQEAIRASDTAARLGGDEFVVMLEDLAPDTTEAAEQARVVAQKVLAALNQPYQLAGHELRSTPSIGVTLFAGQRTSIDELMRQADLAMYQSKSAGRNALHFFDPQMQAAISQRVQLDTDLRASLERGDFRLHYQAQVNARGKLVGAEALLRWEHPQRGTVLPGEFIGLAEETGFIVPLGKWVLEAACRQLAQWASDAETADLMLSVNVSARQFQQDGFVPSVLEVLQKTGARPERLRLELTESLLLNDVESVIEKMTLLKQQGIGFALDDFGTGYSSLAYLRRLPLDVIKIDRSFVRDILIDLNVASIAHYIVTLARNLGLTVVAEGVEQAGQYEFLVGQGCTGYQGYYFGRPVPAEELLTMQPS